MWISVVYVDLSPDHDREHVLPDGTFELIVNLQEIPRKLFHGANSAAYDAFERGWISGAHSKFLVIDALPRSSMIGVHFKPGGAAAFLGVPGDELAGQVVELDAVWVVPCGIGVINCSLLPHQNQNSVFSNAC